MLRAPVSSTSGWDRQAVALPRAERFREGYITVAHNWYALSKGRGGVCQGAWSSPRRAAIAFRSGFGAFGPVTRCRYVARFPLISDAAMRNG
jgi:hypothetical protein